MNVCYYNLYTQINKGIVTRVCVCVCVDFFFKLCLPRKPQSNGTPVAMSTLSTQILDSKYHSLLKRNQGFLEEIADSVAGEGKLKDKPEISCFARNQGNVPMMVKTYQKDQVPLWDHLIFKINRVMDSNRVKKIIIHLTMPI